LMKAPLHIDCAALSAGSTRAPRKGLPPPPQLGFGQPVALAWSCIDYRL